jgi:NAD(P)-dependent dehydrogenase (short-subunit alcohol dehydrogenase family)
VLYARSLAKKLAGTGVVVHSCHPGGVATNIWTGAPAWFQPVLTVAKWFMLTPAQGAERITYLAASVEAGQSTGGYFHDNIERAPSKLAQDEALGEKLWALSEQLVGLK